MATRRSVLACVLGIAFAEAGPSEALTVLVVLQVRSHGADTMTLAPGLLRRTGEPLVDAGLRSATCCAAPAIGERSVCSPWPRLPALAEGQRPEALETTEGPNCSAGISKLVVRRGDGANGGSAVGGTARSVQHAFGRCGRCALPGSRSGAGGGESLPAVCDVTNPVADCTMAPFPESASLRKAEG